MGFACSEPSLFNPGWWDLTMVGSVPTRGYSCSFVLRLGWLVNMMELNYNWSFWEWTKRIILDEAMCPREFVRADEMVRCGTGSGLSVGEGQGWKFLDSVVMAMVLWFFFFFFLFGRLWKTKTLVCFPSLPLDFWDLIKAVDQNPPIYEDFYGVDLE